MKCTYIQPHYVYHSTGQYTVEPLNNGHIETSHLSFIERLSSLRRLKCTIIIVKGTQRVLYREVLFQFCPFLEVLLYTILSTNHL